MRLETFLVKAKQNTYAAGLPGGEQVLADGCKELTYHDGEYAYRDRYYGENPFAGEEVVWHAGRIVWAMNYYGAVTDANAPSAEIPRFLKSALKLVPEDRPFRGPSLYRDGECAYFCESQGFLGAFTGRETITFRGVEVYFLVFHGGSLG
jgi:hypothetical protein